MGKVKKVLIGVLVGLSALVLLLIVVGVTTDPPQEEPATKPTTSAPKATVPTTETTKEAVAQPTETKAEWFEEGTYEVGSKSDPEAGTIKPGTYLLGTTDHCYWKRLSGFSGDFDEIIANGNLDASGDRNAQSRLTIKKSDKGLALEGMCILGQKGGLK